MNSKKWTFEQEQQLIELKYDGYDYLAIAELMGRTPDSLRKKHWLLMQQYNTPTFWKSVEYLRTKGIIE